jgi:hypothetical protein
MYMFLNTAEQSTGIWQAACCCLSSDRANRRNNRNQLKLNMKKLKYLAAVLIAITGLGLQQAKAVTYTLSVGNTALTNAGFTGPYGTVSVTLDATHTIATVVFTASTQTINGTTYKYMFGDGSSAAVNVNAQSWTLGAVTGTCVGCTGFTPGAYTNAGSGNVDGFGVLNQTINSFDGFTHSATQITFTLTNTGGTWGSDASVLTPNAQNASVAAHIFVTLFPANSSNSALATGFAANGGAVIPDGGTTVMLLGVALGALGVVRRYLTS